ncbi:gibberellin 3-beta-dioxygenase 3 [Mercurialis annua]|uniref:gibberellin 3-beta-dioxygenase 3 n=1 Tax=Mercurialis annua TaxID=3986 RepID=UPI002160972C|nr:gibberellin 3-beta-dioxygenase 3 [Mercurialis annua]
MMIPISHFPLTRQQPKSFIPIMFNPIKENPNLDHILPLDFTAVQTLPDSHKWTTTNNTAHSPELTSGIPIIDLTDQNADTLIRQACEKWGMFQVTNHGIPFDLFDKVETQTRYLFALPANRKLLVARSPEGLSGYGQARISSFFTKEMWYEGFTIIGSPAEHATKLWPNQNTLFCEVMEKYQKEMKALSERIIVLICKSLGLNPEDLDCLFRPNNESNNNQGVLQLNSYPMCPDPERAMGLAPHTDSSLLTILHQGGVSGLQVYGEEIGWVAVHPVEGALVVNLGDLMHIISNGRFKSAEHQAVVNKTRHRISAAYFYGPPTDVKISPLKKLIDFDHPMMYRPVTWKEYLDAKALYFHKALEIIKT